MEDNNEFVELMQESMALKGVTVRGLENEIRSKYEENARVSRSSISLYLRGKSIPTFEAGFQIARALDMDIEKAMESLSNQRLDTVLADENKRYKDFLKSIGND